ncbi:hypothetical protein PIB30_055004 [Stylosanthes scabra]|uniref:At2g35280-like TPR domain-containing protein n=1 Tax=Stylosanthes scabra TaxID=79078 RepID=A0ABU6YJ46_9FABA|nr:hypothetical protein [Stylosanthes scabra]
MIGFTWSPAYKLLIPKTPDIFNAHRDCSSAGLGLALGAAVVDITGYPSRRNYPLALMTMGVNPNVKVLPEEVWVHIATMVGKESFSDLLSMKQANKFFRSVAKSEEVYKHARLVKLPPFAYLRFLERSERRLIKQCLKNGNPEAVFLKGHQQYFTVGDEEVGWNYIVQPL